MPRQRLGTAPHGTRSDAVTGAKARESSDFAVCCDAAAWNRAYDGVNFDGACRRSRDRFTRDGRSRATRFMRLAFHRMIHRVFGTDCAGARGIAASAFGTLLLQRTEALAASA